MKIRALSAVDRDRLPEHASAMAKKIPAEPGERREPFSRDRDIH
jgi:hypothetical protein